MAVKYRPIDGEVVSAAWFPLLHDIRHIDRVQFNVNEGHRTFDRQRELVAEKGLWGPSNPTGAAAPSDNAPHIRTGRSDHAIDFNNALAVIAAARRRGVTLRQTVMPHEPWHVEADLADLIAYNARRRTKVARLRRQVRKARRRLASATKTLRKWVIG